jgi:hypothetical protein
MSALTHQLTLTELIGHTTLYTSIWAAVLLVYQRNILPTILTRFESTWFNHTVNQTNASNQQYLIGRFLIGVHHTFVTGLALGAMWHDDATLMQATMLSELAIDVFDVIVIASTARGFTGLNWAGILLHHLLSILAISIALTQPLSIQLLARIAIVLDGTGAADYWTNTIALHSPLIQCWSVFKACAAVTVMFFVVRLVYFPWLGLCFVRDAFAHGISQGIVCLGIILLTCFFNVGMIKTRLRQYKRVYASLQAGQPAYLPMESRTAAKHIGIIADDDVQVDSDEQLP